MPHKIPYIYIYVDTKLSHKIPRVAILVMMMIITSVRIAILINIPIIIRTNNICNKINHD